MMRWMFAMCVIGGLAGCQLVDEPPEPETGVTSAALTPEDPCDATMPSLVLYKGQAVPLPTSSQLYIVVPSPYVQGEKIASLVDTSTNKVVYAARLTPNAEASFYAMAGKHGRLVIPGRPPPPPDILGKLMAFSGARYASSYDAAWNDAKSCSAN